MSQSAEVFAALRDRDGAALEALLASNPGLAQSADPTGVSALLTAVYVGSPDLVDLLIRHGAVPDLFAAAALGETARLEQLLTEAPDRVDEYSPDGWTSLALAAHLSRDEAVRVLLEHGADIHARSRNTNRNTPLHAALSGQSLEAAAILLEEGADVNAADAFGWTPLHLAADSGRADLVLLVLGGQPFIDPENRDGMTPIALARRGGHTRVIELLRPHSASRRD